MNNRDYLVQDIFTGQRIRRITRGKGEFYLPYFTNRAFPQPGRLLALKVANGKATPYLVDPLNGDTEPLSISASPKDLWLAVCGLTCSVTNERIFWMNNNIVHLLSAANGTETELYRSPPGWEMLQGSCTADGNTYAVGEVRSSFLTRENPDTIRQDEEAHLWQEQPVGRIIMIDLVSGKTNCVLELNAMPSHVNIHPFDSNLIMYCYEGHWSYVRHRVWLLEVSSGRSWKACCIPEGYGIGHEVWTATGNIIFHGSTLCLEPVDKQKNLPDLPFTGIIGMADRQGNLIKTFFDRNILSSWAAVSHVVMSHNEKSIVSGGQWTRDFLSLSPWHGKTLKPRLLARHHAEHGHGYLCPRFSPDDRFVYFCNAASQAHHLYEIDLQDHHYS